MLDRDKIEQIVNQHLAETPHFLVEIKTPPSNEVEVIIDSDERLTIDDCAKLSKVIEAEFDRDKEDFQLSVSSAGIGQPLKTARQYSKTVGRMVEVILKSGLKIVATLTEVENQEITLQYQAMEKVEGKKRKVETTQIEKYSFDQIKTIKETLTIH